ncbi:MAG: 4-hydroxythreonine-4-phosphate dehydrogenase PdxA [Pseudomonadota bacterium]
MKHDQSKNDLRVLAVTAGDPLGVGGELTLKAWHFFHQKYKDLNILPFVAIDRISRLQQVAKSTGLQVNLCSIKEPVEALQCFEEALPVIEIPQNDVRMTDHHPLLGQYSIEMAVKLCQQKKCAGMVTNPIHKARLHETGFKYPGHSEYLGFLDNKPVSVMLLASPHLKTVPITIHMPLSKIFKHLTTDLIIEHALIVQSSMQIFFNIAQPNIAIAGLNPHAGEDGYLGHEDIEIIAPAISALKQKGLNVFGPVASDSLFAPHKRKTYDVALCMYHDQALIPVKTLNFDHTVNITLGLSFIRTSPDHGTAFDIAGKGIVNPASFISAIETASLMVKNKRLVKNNALAL